MFIRFNLNIKIFDIICGESVRIKYQVTIYEQAQDNLLIEFIHAILVLYISNICDASRYSRKI